LSRRLRSRLEKNARSLTTSAGGNGRAGFLARVDRERTTRTRPLPGFARRLTGFAAFLGLETRVRAIFLA
jgi:hypothetical protein